MMNSFQKRAFRGGFAVSALAVSIALAAAPAAAQDEEGAEAQEADDTPIMVTGSRIQRKDFSSASPVVTVDAETFDQFGVASPEQYLNTLPQVFASRTTASNNPATGGITPINLRGLGNNRTLALIDGRRVVSSDGSNNVDVSQFPTVLIDRVEVVTGGASAAYGSDAIGGAVNFILRDDLEGLDLSAQFGITDEGDGEGYLFEGAYGWQSSGGEGGFTVYASYNKREPVLAQDRDFAVFPLQPVFDANGSVTGFDRVNVDTVAEGIYTPNLSNLPTQAAIDSVFGSYGVAPGTISPLDVLGFNGGDSLFSLDPLTNFTGSPQPESPYIRTASDVFYLEMPVERWSAGILGSWEIGDSAELYGRFSYVNSTVSRQISAQTFNSNIPVSNPFVPGDLATILASRPNPTASFRIRKYLGQIGGRQAIFETDFFDSVAGVRGDFGKWNYDLYVTHGEVTVDESQPNSILNSVINNSVGAADGGASICTGGYNPFGAASLSQDCIDAISVAPVNTNRLTQTVVEGTLGGPLFALPAGDVQVALGANRRWNDYVRTNDPELAGLTTGFRTDGPAEAQINVTELFGEIAIPLLSGAPGVDLLEIGAGYRYSDYSTVGGVHSYKFDGMWRPIPDLLFRASYQRAVRAPDFNESFFPIGDLNQNLALGDPCSVAGAFRNGLVPGVDPADVRDLCIAQGIPAGVVDSFTGNSAVQGTIGGNPDLQPEKANTISFGASWTPDSIPGLRLTADYYDVEIQDTISLQFLGDLIVRCFNAFGSNPDYNPNDTECLSFTRSPAGEIEGGLSSWFNLGEFSISGVDLQLEYGFGIGELGRLQFNLLASHVTDVSQRVFATDPAFDYAGSIGSSTGEVFPDWKTAANVQWSSGPAMLGVRWRHISAMQSRIQVEAPDAPALGTPAVNYIDLTGRYQVTENFSIFAGIDNLFDQEPPIYSSPISFDANTDPATFDIIGRRFFVRANFRM